MKYLSKFNEAWFSKTNNAPFEEIITSVISKGYDLKKEGDTWVYDEPEKQSIVVIPLYKEGKFIVGLFLTSHKDKRSVDIYGDNPSDSIINAIEFYRAKNVRGTGNTGIRKRKWGK